MSNKDLSNMGSARLSIEQLNGEPCIRKQGAGEIEISFYQNAAQHLSGVNSPKLLAVKGDDLFIEHIPHSLTLNELQASPEAYQQLSRIHQSQYFPNFAVKEHCWKRSDTEAALASLKLPQVTQDSLLRIQKLSGVLFDHKTLVSGDANEGNWGRRANGQLVLFDWERFGYGSPAIDLAPLVSRMGTLSDYEFIVDHYLHHNNLISREDLIRQLIIAKSWIVIEVTNILVARNNPQASKYIQWYREQIPTWLSLVEGRL
ncbi:MULTISPECIES: phosphotransferase [unclassified Vibrio]|uniref:phosphotransferase n=1 Tax=unclassified Vibrio TaxID=2614977 RepID=UPI00159E06F3|nr:MULTISPECIES: phosphotransferase [unclassified Vibrio]NVN83987.1 choline kinase [Vibrio sp. Scap16]QLE93878.1 choline kinase [Vibrio sp. Scap24]